METKIRSLIKEAMIEKNKNKQSTYKNILETAQKKAKETQVAVTDEMIINATKNEIKQLNDFIGFCEAGSDRANEAMEKIEYCKAILPQMASEEDIMNFLVESNIEKNIGTCMKALKEKFGANMDGKMASMVAKEYVSK